jgi:hypothetical protein
MTPEVTPTTPVAEKFIAKSNLFDLDKFERRTVEKEYTFAPVESMEKALEAVQNDNAKLLEVINTGLKRLALSEAKASLRSDSLVSPKVVGGFVNQFKPLYPAKNDSKEARKEQAQKIYAFIRGQEAILTLIKSIAAATAEDDDDDNGAPEDAV